jgi:hypothetical protein
VRDLYQTVAPVCRKWNILARHPCFRQELSFSGEDISTSNACKLLRESPLLRKLTLRGRHDSDAILKQVCESNRRLESLEMDKCRGSVETPEVKGGILAMTLEVCPRLCHLTVMDTLLRRLEFYRVLGRHDGRMKFLRILCATKVGLLCYLKARTQAEQRRKERLNNVLRSFQILEHISRKRKSA